MYCFQVALIGSGNLSFLNYLTIIPHWPVLMMRRSCGFWACRADEHGTWFEVGPESAACAGIGGYSVAWLNKPVYEKSSRAGAEG